MGKCLDCNGSGVCSFCQGTGRITINHYTSLSKAIGVGSGTSRCYVCGGSGIK